MTIYLDMYFLKNMLFNFLLIYLTSLIIRKKFKLFRGLIASSIGALYAVTALYSLQIFNSVTLKIATSIMMLIITFGGKEITTMLSGFYMLAYLIAGIVASLLNVNFQFLIVILATSMIIRYYMYKQNRNHNEYYEICIELLNERIELIAKLDSGNELKESIFGDSVIVLSEEKVKMKFGEELIKILNNESLEISNKYKNKIKLITFNTIAGEGIKIGIKLDQLIIKTETKTLVTNAIMILSEKSFRNYDALIGKSLIEGGFEYENNAVNKIKNKGII